MAEEEVRVVADVNALVDGVCTNLRRSSRDLAPQFAPTLDVPGRFLDAFLKNSPASLWVSPHILNKTAEILQEPWPQGVGFSKRVADNFAEMLGIIARRSGGGMVTPDPSVVELADWEDNLVLGTAVAAGPGLIVGSDAVFQLEAQARHIQMVQPMRFVKAMERVQTVALKEARAQLFPRGAGHGGIKPPGA